MLVIEASPTPGLVRYVEGLLAGGRYSRIVPVGTSIDVLSPLANFGTEADLWAARLASLGVDRDQIEIVRAPDLARHRTAHKALAIRRHLDTRPAEAIDLVSPSTHARRSLLLYEQALAPTVVGILSAPQPYDEKRWWNSSAGVRMVIGELLALGYFCVGRDELEQAQAVYDEVSSSMRSGLDGDMDVPSEAEDGAYSLPSRLPSAR